MNATKPAEPVTIYEMTGLCGNKLTIKNFKT